MAWFKAQRNYFGTELYKEKEDVYDLIDCLTEDMIAFYTYGILQLDYDVNKPMHGFVQHMMDSQDFISKEYYTRAIHYIIEFSRKDVNTKNIEKVKRFTSYLSGTIFTEYQHIIILRKDGDHYNIHIIINPLNLSTLKTYWISNDEFRYLIWKVNMFMHHVTGIQIPNVAKHRDTEILMDLLRTAIERTC